MEDFTQQGEYAGKELFYKSKFSLTPKRKVASYVGRLCEEGKYRLNLASIFANEDGGIIWIDVNYF